MATTTLTERNHRITLMIGGVAIPDPWKKFSGGDLTSESTLNRPGGMGDQEPIGGVSERGDITLEREHKWDRDGSIAGAPGRFLDQAVVDNAESVVTVQRLNNQRQPVGSPDIYRGIIKGVSPAELDSEGSGVMTYAVICSAVA